MTFGERLRAAHERANVSEPTLAAEAGISVTQLRALKADRVKRPIDRTVAGLARALGVTVDYLRNGGATMPDDADERDRRQSESYRNVLQEELIPVLSALASLAESVAQLHDEHRSIHAAVLSPREDARPGAAFREPR